MAAWRAESMFGALRPAAQKASSNTSGGAAVILVEDLDQPSHEVQEAASGTG